MTERDFNGAYDDTPEEYAAIYELLSAAIPVNSTTEEYASETIDAAEVDEVFGGHLPPDVKQVINSLGGRNLRILPQCEDGTYLSGIYERGDDNYAQALVEAIADDNIVVMNCILEQGGALEGCPHCSETPWLAACFNGSMKIVKYLLARGAHRANF